jgi:hypothetical protein
MARNGVDDPFRGDDEQEPEELAVWLAQGFTAEDAQLWRRWQFTVIKARRWMAAGVDRALVAAQWQTAGVRAHQVRAWVNANITPAEAVSWLEFGFDLRAASDAKAKGLSPSQMYNQNQQHMLFQGRSGPHEYEKWRSAGIQPEVIRTYVVRPRTGEDNLRWAIHNIESADSEVWDALGLTPQEAGRLTQEGRTPADVMRDWWPTGIPIDEVADWIGAGLTASEAAARRARGFTTEQAAELRAVRTDDDAGT